MSDESDNLMDAAPSRAERDRAGRVPLGADEFQALLVEVLPTAYGYALRLTRNRADAEDLVQDAALRAFRAIDVVRARNELQGVDLSYSHALLLGQSPAAPAATEHRRLR